MASEELKAAAQKELLRRKAKAELERRRSASTSPINDTMQNIESGLRLINPVMGAAQKLGDMIAPSVPDIAKGIVDSGISAATLPGRVMNGDVRMTGADGNVSPEAIAESTNLATWAIPAVPRGTAITLAKPTPTVPLAVTSQTPAVVQSARNIGVDLPRALSSESQTVHNIGQKLAEIPVVGTPIRNAVTKATEQLDDAATNLRKGLGTGDMAVAGNKFRQSAKTFAKDIEPAAVSELYKKVDDAIDPNKGFRLTNTANLARNLAARDARQGFTSNKTADFVKGAVSDGVDMAYQDIKGLRTRVGNMLKDPQKKEMANLGVNEQDLDALYASLTEDMKAAIKGADKTGGEAIKLWEQANNRAAIFARDKEALRKIVNADSDEAVASNLIAMAGNTSRANVKTLLLAKSKVGTEAWNEIGSAAVSKMSTENSGFSPAKFSTNWEKMSEGGKKILFSPETRKSLDDIAAVSKRMKDASKFANASQSGALVLSGSAFTSAIAGLFEPTTLVVGGATMGAGRGMSWYLARPERIKAVADFAKAYEVAAKMPGKTSQLNYTAKARALAALVANDVGDPAVAQEVFKNLVTPSKSAADNQTGDQLGQPESQPQAETQQQRFQRLLDAGMAL